MPFEKFLKTMGANIASLRRGRNFSQKEAAALADISYRYYQSIEAGVANLTLSTVFRLAEFFKVSPHELLCKESAHDR